MNIKTLLLSPVLLLCALGAGNSLNAGFLEEMEAVNAGTQPFIAVVVRLKQDPSLIHLVGKGFGWDAPGREREFQSRQDGKTQTIHQVIAPRIAEAVVRINGQVVASERVNQHRITVALPRDLAPDANVTVTVHGQESMREALWTPAVLEHPDRLLRAERKAFKRSFAYVRIPDYKQVDMGVQNSSLASAGITWEAFNYMVKGAFPDQLQACVIQ